MHDRCCGHQYSTLKGHGEAMDNLESFPPFPPRPNFEVVSTAGSYLFFFLQLRCTANSTCAQFVH